MLGENMLLQLDIHNIALIDEVNIELGDGLNILTGETGAGKSIIIDSINAVLGGRISKEIIRTGSERAMVEAAFQIDNERFEDIFGELGVESEEDGTLILSREITQSGRNTCRVNGKLAAVSVLRAIGERLIDLHGQHDNQSLIKAENHIELLDSFGGEAIQQLKREYSALLEQYRDIKARLKSLSGDPGQRERKIDLLKFQIDEIKKSKLKPEEEDELNRQKLLLTNAEKIAGSLSTAYSLISADQRGSRPVTDVLNEALSQLSTVSRLDEGYGEMLRRLQDIIYQLDDLTEDVRKNYENVEFNPGLLEEIQERLDLIYKLKRKYGKTIPEIYQFCSESEIQLDELVKSEENVIKLKAKKTELEGLLYEVCRKLNERRVKTASILEDRICKQLDELEMRKAGFKADIQFDSFSHSPEERKFTNSGLDKVEFLISANVGEPLKPLAKIASGGEMSRVMLAIKTILAEVDKIPTMIFDEIDMGISGKAAQKVGEKLAYIARGHQVICVTHLAQIAAMADNHYLIEKVMDEATTKTAITRLEGDKKLHEITRLIGGVTSSEASIKYAEEMLKNAKKS